MKSLRSNVPSMLNKYFDRLETLIGQYREAELKQFKGPDGKNADFDDLIWYHIDPNTSRKTRYLCGRHGNAGNTPDAVLPYPYNHLIKVWIIETTNTPLSASEKQARNIAARKLLSSMEGNLDAQTSATIDTLKLSDATVQRLRSFLTFCFDQGLMRKIELKSNDNRDRTGFAAFDNALEKLPDIATVLALGSIFSTVFKHVNPDGSVTQGETVPMLDAMTVTSGLLSLGSPNRTAAEIPVLPKQRLQSYSENGGKLVFHLDWIGSKGYRNNKNHLLAALEEPIRKALNFFYYACEPARILCRFYENPNQNLRALLGDFQVAPERGKHLSLTKRPNLFTLGYALGFYGVNDHVPVLKNGTDVSDVTTVYHARRGKFFEEKPIYSLLDQDQLSTSRNRKSRISSVPYLFGSNTAFPDIFTGEAVILTVGEVQKCWIKYYREAILPEFPISYSSGESSIRLKDAMFCFLGSWFYKRNTDTGGKKNYMVVPLASLGVVASSRLTGTSKIPGYSSIFEDYGFSSELTLPPHSLRHLANTLAHMSEIPVEITTAWSGRTDNEQTHTYIKTSHDAKADRVRVIINPPNQDKRDIRVVSADELSHATNLPATVSSTGICTQNLNVTPCNYLNDFVAQCFMCSETCHIAGDDKAIDLFEKDFSYQTARVEQVTCDPRLQNSRAMQRWYVIHSRNTHILSHLIDLMKSCPKGTIIRYSNKKAEFSLTDLNTRVITTVACALPDTEGRLKRLLEDKTAGAAPSANPKLRKLLSSFGLSDGGA